MDDNQLLMLYQQELSFIRQLGEQFAEAHPKIAGNLRLSSKTVEDPHVARLMEAFALQNARIRHKIDQDASEAQEAILSILHPHVLAPIPSMTIAHFQINEQKLMTEKVIPAQTELISESIPGGGECYFKTAYPVHLYPFKVVHASIGGKPIAAPNISAFREAGAVLRISLSCVNSKQAFSHFDLDSLRFFINAQSFHANTLYELLFNNLIGIALAQGSNDPQPLVLPGDSLKKVGYQASQGLLPYDQRVFIGYRLLMEYFTLPEKFLFFDLNNLRVISPKFSNLGENLEIFFYLNKIYPNLEKQINRDTFKLGCTPIINLFTKKAEPIALSETQTEYHIIPDATSLPEATEIFSVDKVSARSEGGKVFEYFPFYQQGYSNHNYYYLSRKPAWYAHRYPLSGSECFINFSSSDQARISTNEWVIEVDLTCSNRNLPQLLPFDDGRPFFKIKYLKHEHIKNIACVSSITPAYHPFLRNDFKWRYLSHLQLNFLSLMDKLHGLDVLKQLLRTYHYNANENFEAVLEGLLSLSCKQIIARHSTNGRVSFCRGIEIKLMVDDKKFVDHSLYLLANVLDYFFSLFVSINSFTQLIIINRQNELYRFLPRSGEQLLL